VVLKKSILVDAVEDGGVVDMDFVEGEGEDWVMNSAILRNATPVM
jgi:hypothetical protein